MSSLACACWFHLDWIGLQKLSACNWFVKTHSCYSSAILFGRVEILKLLRTVNIESPCTIISLLDMNAKKFSQKHNLQKRKLFQLKNCQTNCMELEVGEVDISRVQTISEFFHDDWKVVVTFTASSIKQKWKVHRKNYQIHFHFKFNLLWLLNSHF